MGWHLLLLRAKVPGIAIDWVTGRSPKR